MQIRVAAENDAEQIASLSFQLGYPVELQQIVERLAVLLQSSDHKIYVAEEKGIMLGWISCEKRLLLESGYIYEIVGLIVDKNARRKNLGRKLVDAAEHWARSLSADVIRVRSNILREESHPFYEAIGFIKGKTQHAYFKNLNL